MLAAAFADLPTAAWLVPDPTDRLEAVTGQFTILTEHAAAAGGIVTAGNESAPDAAVVWFDHTNPPPLIPDYQERLHQACGMHVNRFLALDAAMHARHPDTPHRYIALVGTRTDRQGHGLATALLGRINDDLDQTQTAAYLEAVSEPTVDLYERLGYRRYGNTFEIGPGGPPLYPMWRTPRPPA